MNDGQNNFVDVCNAFTPEGVDPSFNEVVRRAIEEEGLDKADLACDFQVAVSTISRWCSDVRPHPAMQTYVVGRIAELCD